jgi:hypothetical protein
MKHWIVLVGLVIALICLCGLAIVVRSVITASDYNQHLRELGIVPSAVGIEDYIWHSIQLGTSKAIVMKRLAPLGQVNVAKMGAQCEGLAINLQGDPEQTISVFVPPDGPPGYQVGLCYSNDKVSEILSFSRVEVNGTIHSILPTLQARPTSKP